MVTRCPLALGLLVVLIAAAAQADEQSAADEATLRTANMASDGPALLEFFRKRSLSEADQQRLGATVRQLGDPDFAMREKASADLVAGGRLAVPFLKAVLQDPDAEVVRRAGFCLEAIQGGENLALTLAAARLLIQRKPAGATQAILNYLPFVDDEVIEEEIVGTLQAVAMNGDKADPLLLAGLKDKLPIRRAAAALIVGRSGTGADRIAVRQLLTDPEPKVRLRAAQGLVAGKDKTPIPMLVDLLTDSPTTLAWQAEELLCQIAGEQAPAVSVGTGSDEARRKSREAWGTWWRQHGAAVDLTKLDLDHRLLGLTLIVCYDGYKGTGRVWECGLDGKPRWEINNVNNPLDAQILPGNRVLITEYSSSRITERDFQGNILKEHKIKANPNACQRLSNGNLLVSTWPQEILELTADDKPVFSHQSRHGNVTFAQKMRNGHAVFVTQSGEMVEVDEKGKEVKNTKFNHNPGWRLGVDVLPGGRFLVNFQGANKVVEYDAAGKTLWECPAPSPTTATRLPNGNTLICCNEQRVVEVDRAGKTVWEQKLLGRPFRAKRR